MKKINRYFANEHFCSVAQKDLDELEQQIELLKGKNKGLQNVVDNYYTNSAISMLNDLREKLAIVAQQRDEAAEALIECKLMIDGLTYGTGSGVLHKLIEKLTGKTWEEIKAGER